MDMVAGSWTLTVLIVLISYIQITSVYPLKFGKEGIPLSWCSKTPLKTEVSKFKQSLIGFVVFICLALGGPLTKYELYFLFNFTDLMWNAIFTLWCFSVAFLMLTDTLCSGAVLNKAFSYQDL